MGNAGTNDFILVHDGTDNIINCGNNGNLFQRAQSIHLQSLLAENKLVAETDGQVEIFYDNTKRLETFASGAKWIGQFQGPVAGDSIQWTGSSSNAFLMAMSDGNDLPANSSTNMNFHHWNGTAWKK